MGFVNTDNLDARFADTGDVTILRDSRIPPRAGDKVGLKLLCDMVGRYRNGEATDFMRDTFENRVPLNTLERCLFVNEVRNMCGPT